MELSDGILKAMESSFVIQYGTNFENVGYVMTFNDDPFLDGSKVQVFANVGAAKRTLTDFCRNIFWQGEYRQQYKDNIKKQTGYDVDFTATIAILPQYGATDRFEKPEAKEMFKNLGLALIEKGIVKIKKIKLPAVAPQALEKIFENEVDEFEKLIDKWLHTQKLYKGESVTLGMPSNMRSNHVKVIRERYVKAGWSDVTYHSDQRDGDYLTFKY
jgi:hypothetical protein